MPKVPVQKGKIISNPPTMKQMPHVEREKERMAELRELKNGQTLEKVTPYKKK